MIQPVFFISHDDPNQVVNKNHSSYKFLNKLAKSISKPKAILCISAHWERSKATISGADKLETIHDFYGFPESFYQLDYQPPGNPALANEIKELLVAQGIASQIDSKRGIDHGAWCVLMPLFPNADVPILQLSINPNQSAKKHFELGEALRPLREKGVLIIGSGTMTHNLSEWRRGFTYDMPIEPYAKAFRDWVSEKIENQHYEQLVEYKDKAPYASRCHPTPDHILPLFVAAGAAVEADQARLIDDSYIYGSFSMASFKWG